MIAATPGGVRLTVYVQPGASRSNIVGRHGDAIKVRLAAPPVDGRANEALVVFIATKCGVASSDVTLVRGHVSRRKTLDVTGVSATDIERRLLGG